MNARRWADVATGAAVSTLTVALLGMAPREPKVVRAEQFVVTDDRGHQRANLGWTKGGVVLDIEDARGRNRIMVGTEDSGASAIAITSADGRSVATLIVPADGEPYLGFKDRDGEEHKVRP